MEDIHAILDELAVYNGRCVLATIIKVEGSSYKKAGASMLFKENGTSIGLLSGGCLEEDLALRAEQLMSMSMDRTLGKNSDVVIYDLSMEDDLSWGKGIGCNGIIYVLLEFIDVTLKSELLQLKDNLDNKRPILHYKKLTHDFILKTYGFCEIDENLAEIKGMPEEILNIVNGVSVFQRVSALQKITDEASLFVHIYWPKPTLYIFGAGADVRPLAQASFSAGLNVSIIDQRPTYCCAKHFPNASLQVLSPVSFIENTLLTPYDAVIVMTHNFDLDQRIIRLMLEEPVFYLGILGPRRRTGRLFKNQQIPLRVESPAGKNIGAEGPEEIAISILASIIERMRACSQVVGR